ncbi:MAG: hypothetical protein OEV64_05055 [Desulfobulbaceae bacterium]|nr:hypothetical protein [Desulfobulbaceae bacterium]
MSRLSDPIYFRWLNLTDSAIDKGESCKMNIGWGYDYPLEVFLICYRKQL